MRRGLAKANGLSSAFADFLQRIQPVVVDLGARGGGDADLLPFAWACKLIGFEPEPYEAQRLMQQGDARWGAFVVVPSAVGGKEGRARLHLPQAEQGASLYPHNEKMLELFGYEALHKTVRTLEVETTTLKSVVGQYGLANIDYLKIDVEGAELDILRSMEEELSVCLAIKVEVSFLEQRCGQSLAWELMELLQRRGFYLADMQNMYQWRRRPLPPHPYVSRHVMAYSKGLSAQCDLVFLRDFQTVSDHAQALRLSCIAALLGYFDYAVSVLREYPAAGEFAMREYGLELEREYQKMSQSMGRKAAWKQLQTNLRQCVPLLRSLLTGLPTAPIKNW